MQRLRVQLTGYVQGVGFRPCVYRVAKALDLTGWVKNNSEGVEIEIQGKKSPQFIECLKENLPPLATLDTLHFKNISPLLDEDDFSILPSDVAGKLSAKISPDMSICDDCLKELFDSSGRFYLYPFLNCTNCGPRLTITENLPYDRAQTSMRDFQLCNACADDYQNPLDRRYHAQPIACQQCGPALSMPVTEIVGCLRRGEIIALKGVGGYQLICDATNSAAIKKLRQRKLRDSKPFALLMLNAKSAEHFVEISKEEKTLLESWQRPIVLLQKKSYSSLSLDAINPSSRDLRGSSSRGLTAGSTTSSDCDMNLGDPAIKSWDDGLESKLSNNIADGLSELGIMLPSSAIHYLLFHGLLNDPQGTQWLDTKNDLVLIATSANTQGEPLIIDDSAALEELSRIADVRVSYNREILTRADDSVMRVLDGAPYFIRRARGFTPRSIKLAKKTMPGIALGGLLKNTICVTRDHEAFVSQYLGDMDNPSAIEFFHETLDYFLNVLKVKPEFIAHDLHPDFYTTQFAQRLGIPAIGVQHHHAHLASVVAEHQMKERALGIALDGYGYGANGESWGGELMLLEGAQYQHLSSLKTLPQPGGDIAAREPWRMAAGLLHALNKVDEIEKRFGESNALLKLLNSHINIPQTSSGGRLFDTASALLGVCHINRYEGEAAMLLESLVTQPTVSKGGWIIQNNELSFFPLMQHLLTCDKMTGANIFHGTLIAGLTDWILQHAKQYKTQIVLLSGGCFLNKTLTEGLLKNLRHHHLTPLIPRQLPPNDGGLSLGQAWIASAAIPKDHVPK